MITKTKAENERTCYVCGSVIKRGEYVFHDLCEVGGGFHIRVYHADHFPEIKGMKEVPPHLQGYVQEVIQSTFLGVQALEL